MSRARLRVLDLTDGLAAYGARALVGVGAEVIRIESGMTHPTTTRLSAADLHWHAGKRVLSVPDGPSGDAAVRRLVDGADIVLESGQRRDLRTLALRDRSPADWRHVVHVVVTPFGLTGPRADWLADDDVAAAAGGMTWLGGFTDSPPVAPPREQAGHLAGSHAAIAALMALSARTRTGCGQLIDISVQEAVASSVETGAIAWIHGGTVPGRTGGVYGHVAHRLFRTADGWVAGGYSGSNRMWDDLLAWLIEVDEAEDLTDPRWLDPVIRWRERRHVDEVIARFARRRSSEQIAVEARCRALPWADVAAPASLPANPHLQARHYFTEIVTESGPVVDAGFPYASPRMPRPVRLDAPVRINTAHTDTVDWETRPEPVQRAAPVQQAGRVQQTGRGSQSPGFGALQGIRVLDLTWVLAGPYATKTLGDHGADIIKVESRHRQDPTRFAPSMRLRADAGPDEGGYFLNFNRNKRSLALNLRTEEGQALLRRLAAEVDVIIENFSPGVLDRWGLGYSTLAELNPQVILVSMAGLGHTGPWKRSVTFADTLGAMSGLTHETWQQDRPCGLTFGLGDIVAANAAAMAVAELLALGEGGHVDLSQLEAMAAHLGPATLDGADRNTPDRILVRTRGEDRWLAVGRGHRDRVTEVIAGYGDGADLDADELAADLQSRGVPAHPVRDGRDLVESDPQLAAREFYPTLDHPLRGPVRHEGIVSRFTETPGRLTRPAPLLGQHSRELLIELLGLTEAELAELEAKEILT